MSSFSFHKSWFLPKRLVGREQPDAVRKLLKAAKEEAPGPPEVVAGRKTVREEVGEAIAEGQAKVQFAKHISHPRSFPEAKQLQIKHPSFDFSDEILKRGLQILVGKEEQCRFQLTELVTNFPPSYEQLMAGFFDALLSEANHTTFKNPHFQAVLGLFQELDRESFTEHLRLAYTQVFLFHPQSKIDRLKDVLRENYDSEVFHYSNISLGVTQLFEFLLDYLDRHKLDCKSKLQDKTKRERFMEVLKCHSGGLICYDAPRRDNRSENLDQTHERWMELKGKFEEAGLLTETDFQDIAVGASKFYLDNSSQYQ